MSDYAWSEEQEAIRAWAATARPGAHLMVEALAGTGKSTTMRGLIECIPDPGARIIVLAYNRLIKLAFQAACTDPRATIQTFNGCGFAALRRHWPRIRVDDQVEWDRLQAAGDGQVPDEIAGLGKRLLSLAKVVEPLGGPAAILDLAERFGILPSDEWQADGWSLERLAGLVLAARNASAVRDATGRVSFDDQIFVPLACGMHRAAWDWVLVDERQDMNTAQLAIVRRLCAPEGHIVLVGDRHQAIYGFRGADSDAADRLGAELGAETLPLTTTYRCARGIVAVAAALVPAYRATPHALDGTVDHAAEGALHGLVQPGNAILSRTNAPLVPICLQLIRKGIPARIEGRDIGRTLAGTVRKLKARSVPDFLRRLRSWADREQARAKARGGRHVETRCEAIEEQHETLAALAEGCVSVDEITTRCERMFSDTVDSEGRRQAPTAVVCSTVHKAKGLEWDRVFLLSRTLYCGGWRRDDPAEANIHYVAVTRAKAHLTLLD